ncbi:hypothetical protein CABS01_17063 [Colletotrichum abscissum]|nr:uncharacterized protein CABS01_17063 [Colletotrichum abscissum]KAK1496342.1 hypothetical protein CABS01_17063 [Colletotrichum abscissum]
MYNVKQTGFVAQISPSIPRRKQSIHYGFV